MPIDYGVLHKLMRTKPSVAPTNPYVLGEYIDDGETNPEKLEARKSQVEKSLAEKAQTKKPRPEDYKNVFKKYISSLNHLVESSRDHKPRKLAKVRLKMNEDIAH